MTKLFKKSFSKTELLRYIGNISQIGGAREYELTTGKAKGVRAVDIRTGAGLCFTVLPDRGMDIAWADYKGVPLAFISKADIAAPQLFNRQEFLRSFFVKNAIFLEFVPYLCFYDLCPHIAIVSSTVSSIKYMIK